MNFNLLKNSALAAALAIPMTVAAGNIPQYMFSAEEVDAFTPFTDGTEIPCSWQTGVYNLLPGGVETPNTINSEGWDLGMNFRFGGREFNRFVIDNQGDIYLGVDKLVDGEAFTIRFANLMYAINQGSFSYKISGDEGNRVFTLQLLDAVTSEITSIKGKYNLQISLHEADGRVEVRMHQIEAPYATGMSFSAGIMGWDDNDVLYLVGDGLRPASEISTGSTMPDLLIPGTTLRWDSEDYDDDENGGFTMLYSYTPVLSKDAPAGSPSELEVTQEGSTLNISCVRDENAPATVILWSDEPFTEADYPTDGKTFKAGEHAVFGKATAIYYGNDDAPKASIQGVKPGQAYYVQALSVTGYPVYGKGTPAEVVYATTQASPSVLSATATSATSAKVEWRAADPVIVAMSTEAVPGWEKGYAGVFGKPEAGVQAGDIIEGGGHVVYAGDASECTVTLDPNKMTYFRAWTVKDGVVSSTATDAFCVGSPAIPYMPALETYPKGLPLAGWDATSDSFLPFLMKYNKIDALRAISVNGADVSLTSPLLPLDIETELTFEFALETVRDAEVTEGGVPVPGSEPGKFGNGSIRVFVGDTEVGSVNHYDGTMTPSGDGYEDGSATMQKVSFKLPAAGEARVTLRMNTEKTSVFYVRDIQITNTVGVGSVSEADKTVDFTQPIYNVAGIRMHATSAEELPAGLYIVGGKKVAIRK